MPRDLTSIMRGFDAIPENAKELHAEAVALEESGDISCAATLYEKTGNDHKAIRLYEANGDFIKAYELAKRSGDKFTENRLAVTHNIQGHEYSGLPPAQGRTYEENIRLALGSRLKPETTAGRLGFRGFQGQVVADVGCNDGRFVPMFRELGASEVYGVDPTSKALEKAVESGVLDAAHALPMKLQEIPDDLRRRFDTAAVFNFNMPYNEQAGFFRALYDFLPSGGQAVLTIAEDDILEYAYRFASPLFSIRSERLWGDASDCPHKNLVVLTKKPSALVEDSLKIE